MMQSLLLLLAILQTFLSQCCIAVTCYGYNGLEYLDNLICPGSNACCGVNATCETNRLCHNHGDNDSTFVRGPCAVHPYDPNKCADICLYDEVNNFMPRVTPCADGSLCCNNDDQCCSSGRGVFLDSTGQIVSSLPSTSSGGSSSTTTGSTSSTSSTSTTHASSTTSSLSSSIGSISTTSSPSAQLTPAATFITSPSPSASDASSTLSTGAKIGLGVIIPLSVLVLGIFIVVIFFQRRRLRIAEAAANRRMDARSWRYETGHNEQVLQIQEMSSSKSPIMKGDERLPVELPAT